MSDNFKHCAPGDKFNKRCTPEEALKKIKEENHGHLKIFLGYAPGVGKTYTMLNEANRRFDRGQNVAIGFVECHNRADTLEQIKNLKIIPPKEVVVNNKKVYELDLDAIINEHPKIVLIDSIAHTNAEGLKNKKRYEDIEDILNNGIDVLTTLNIEHLESLNLIIRKITGLKIEDTIPDSMVDNAFEVVVVDITPRELLNRLNSDKIYSELLTNHETKPLFRQNSLSALRELSLRRTAEGVDEDLAEYMKAHDIVENWHTVERVMVCISSSPSAKKLIRKGARIAEKFKCELYVVNVNLTSIFRAKLSEKNISTIESHYKLAKQLGAEVVVLNGSSASKTLAQFATEKYITQIIIGTSRRTNFQSI